MGTTFVQDFCRPPLVGMVLKLQYMYYKLGKSTRPSLALFGQVTKQDESDLPSTKDPKWFPGRFRQCLLKLNKPTVNSGDPLEWQRSCHVFARVA